jgi:hypothetical protein
MLAMILLMICCLKAYVRDLKAELPLDLSAAAKATKLQPAMPILVFTAKLHPSLLPGQCFQVTKPVPLALDSAL